MSEIVPRGTKRSLACNDCRHLFRSYLPIAEARCSRCARTNISLAHTSTGRPEKYPWDQWLRSLETVSRIPIFCETAEEAQRLRNRICSNRRRAQQLVISLRGSRVVLTKRDA